MSEKVEHPKHYNVHPSGIECIDVVEDMNFCLGNAIKYIWRADHKENDIIDLRKAIFYLEREIQRRGESKEKSTREPERFKHSESDRLTTAAGDYEESHYKKGRLWLTKHIV